MNTINHPPLLASFLHSLRDIGYSLKTAVADIIDNSITANAKNIKISALYSRKALLIFDDGLGLSCGDLLSAMRLGTDKEVRENGDLGKYGLGLKTASFSQCTKFTIISKAEDKMFGFCWDLELIKETNEWTLLSVEPTDYAEITNYVDIEIWSDITNTSSGTLIIWQNIDRFDSEEDFNHAWTELRSHLGLVFHRYLSKEGFNQRNIHIYFNGDAIDAFDPFASSNRAGNRCVEDEDEIFGHKIKGCAYTLPHYSKLSASEYKKLSTSDGFTKTQGFYLYREGRLLVYGTWFGLARISDASSLSRIMIDVDNQQDHLWRIDVKKSRANPVPSVKRFLKRFVEKSKLSSMSVVCPKGVKHFKREFEPYWEQIDYEEQSFFRINRNTHLVREFHENLSDDHKVSFNRIMTCIENCLPMEQIYGVLATNPHSVDYIEKPDSADIYHIAKSFKQHNKTYVETKLFFDRDEYYRDFPQLYEKVLKKVYADG